MEKNGARFRTHAKRLRGAMLRAGSPTRCRGDYPPTHTPHTHTHYYKSLSQLLFMCLGQRGPVLARPGGVGWEQLSPDEGPSKLNPPRGILFPSPRQRARARARGLQWLPLASPHRQTQHSSRSPPPPIHQGATASLIMLFGWTVRRGVLFSCG